MIYIRNIFRQDLRDGKQIAFPSEPSNLFFGFSFQNGDADREISFVFKENDKNSPINKYDGEIITTRLYAAGSESRIDGQLKKFLIDELGAKVNDKIIFRKLSEIKYDFEFVSSSSPNYGFISELLKSKNHELLLSTDKELTASALPPLVIEDRTFRVILLKSFRFIVEKYGEEVVLKDTKQEETSIEHSSFKAITFPKYFKSKRIIILSNEKLDKEQLKSSGTPRYFDENLELKEAPYTYFTTQWGDDSEDSTLNNFNYLLKDISNDTLEIIKENDIYRLVSKGSKVLVRNYQPIGENKIYFGAPGTGKSHAINEELKKNNVDGKHYARVTFHPDFDYTTFVGGYKPYTDSDDKIKYKFVPQIFINMYVKSWSNLDEAYYLIIEEINRGNCAEIFGDVFQLLDRNPEYNIEPSTELKEYLEAIEQEEAVQLLFDGKLQMPERLSILASMNTSDQSLYPMDSAFKRRWDWEYVAINTQCEKSNFIIEITDTHKYYWLDFLEKVNTRIYEVTKSEDKQLGNWFINATKTNNIISKKAFINKVLFYLWNDIFKDEVFHSENIFIENNPDGGKLQNLSFNDFFTPDTEKQKSLLVNLLDSVLKITHALNADNQADSSSSQSEIEISRGNEAE